MGCDASIGEINYQESEQLDIVHKEEMQIPIEASTLENDEQLPSTSTIDINFTQASLEQLDIVHQVEMQVPIEASILENEQLPSTPTIIINFIQASSVNQENFNQSSSQQFVNSFVVCTCCYRDLFHRGTCHFQGKNCNFDHAIVNRALFHKYHYCTPGMMEYICKVCHNNLRAKEPRMPRDAFARLGKKTGENFLKALQNKPEFVCTCCNQMLFWKTVVVFQENKYDFRNALQIQIRMSQ